MKDPEVLQRLKLQFSERLSSLLTQKGYKLNRRPYYLDISRFANEIDCTATVVRRYISGSALPHFETIEKMGEVLKVDPLWLYCGNEKKTTEINQLKNILNRVLTKKLHNEHSKEINHIIDFGFDIYEQIQALVNATELEKEKLINWMANSMHETDPNAVDSYSNKDKQKGNL